MAATVVNHLRVTFSSHDDIGVAVFYCRYTTGPEQTKEKMLAALLRQLVRREHSVSEKLQTLLDQCKKASRRPTFAELTGLLQHVAGTYSKVFLVVDALDECDVTEWSPLISELRHMQRLLPALRLLTTFRPHVTVTQDFTEAVTLPIRADTWDLEHYVNERVPHLSKHVGENLSLREEVIQGIVKAADGMLVLSTVLSSLTCLANSFVGFSWQSFTSTRLWGKRL
jgi:hypothetical protein